MRPGTMNFTEAREEMVERQLRRRGIRDPRVLDAMRSIPREEFVPAGLREKAYLDEPVQIGGGQTISQPYITALMVESLELTGGETVLEVGAGSGYHAAVLGAIAGRVVSLEIQPALAALAEANLRRAGVGGNVRVICGDGSLGWPEEAPYDAISVAAAAPFVPPALLEQLKDPGRLVIPVGDIDEQDLCLVAKRAGEVRSRAITGCRFVPLRGGQGWR